MATPPPQQPLQPDLVFAQLREMFPQVPRGETREAMRLHPNNIPAAVDYLTSLGADSPFSLYSRVFSLGGFTQGIERPLLVREIKEQDLGSEFAGRFRIANRREDVQQVHLCYPKMEITCGKCSNSWASVGFPGRFGFHSNYDQHTIFGELTTFRQQCKTCNVPLWPKCDADVIKRFLHAIELRIEARGGRTRRVIDEKETHKRELCEGCDVGVCRFTPKES